MSDFRNASPSSDIFTDGLDDSVSIRDKSLLKRSISKHHTSNFKAGYVPVHEQHFNKTGLRGRKTFAFWILVILLFILAVGNLILTFIILGVLKLGQGMQSLEVISEEMAVKFFGDTDLGNIYKRDGKLEGYLDVPIEIVGDNGSIFINVAMKYGRPINKFKIDNSDIIFRNIEQFEVKDKGSNMVFSTNTTEYKNFKNLESINTKMVESNRIVSSINSNATIKAKMINLKGPEGMRGESQRVTMLADQLINLQSNKSIFMNADNGIVLDTKNFYVNNIKHGEYSNTQYKICICMPQGKLFKLKIPNYNSRVYCNQVAHNPCM